MILAIWFWIVSYSLCQSKYIEVNNKGNDSNECCIEGECYCGSLSKALLYVNSETVINITSSVSLDNMHNNVTLIGIAYKGFLALNNITITGNGITVSCNNSGNVACLYCNNVSIEGIIWDQCGNLNNPDFAYALFFKSCSNVSIKACTFQHSKTCNVLIFRLMSGYVAVQDSRFLFNIVKNSSLCTHATSLSVESDLSTSQSIYVIIIGTLFYRNGALDRVDSATIFGMLSSQLPMIVDIENSTVSSSYGQGCYLTYHSTLDSKSFSMLNFQSTTFMNNSNGGLIVQILNVSTADLNIFSSTFAHNVGAMKFIINSNVSSVTFYRTIIKKNKGMFGKDALIGNNAFGQGVGILMKALLIPFFTVNMSYCNIYDNAGSKKSSSIIYLDSSTISPEVFIISSNFSNNIGSALRLSHCLVGFEGLVLFTNNLAERGAAIYIEEGSLLVLGENSIIKFVGNTALQQGGAIYIELLSGCPFNGLTFYSLSDILEVSFTNNSADLGGNSIYFNFPESCDSISEYFIYKFKYSQPPGLVGTPISTSPYRINVCLTSCNGTKSVCHMPNRIMMGQSIGIKATVCDYFGNVGETVQLYIECTDCNSKYRLSNNRILVHNGMFDTAFVAVDANNDIANNENVTLNLSSVFFNENKQLTGTVSVELSSCQSGYIFDTNVQQCKCYSQSKGIIRCQQYYAEIKYGYWFGIIYLKRTVSMCPIHYCKYERHKETTNNYYKLPKELNDQCNTHRTGVACGECKLGYTLAYDSPECINTDKCSAGRTVLVIVLTILYWIIVTILVFGLMQRKVSLGYFYGIVYFYSIIDIVLDSNLFITDGVFQLVTILSGFAKLTPQFLGKLCFVQSLSGIDQQFIHYFHAISIFMLIVATVIAARYSFRIASFVSHCIIRVICLLILLSYTSLTSTSLQLLRPLYFDDLDGAYVYSSPSIKYFTGRHIPYCIIAILCGLFIVIGLPLLLVLEPFLQRKVNFIKIKPLLDQYQECYKDQYHWFAAYYLICRQVIAAIVYTSSFESSLYYLQTACVITVMIHIWIKPYKNKTLNVLDGIILLTIVLAVNLNSFPFSASSTTAIIVIVVIFPLLFSCCVSFKYVSLP